MWWEGVELMHLAQDRDQWRAAANTLMNRLVPQKAENFFTSSVNVSFSRMTVLYGVKLVCIFCIVTLNSIIY